jgi:AraC-like DNA-binding protein
MARFAYAVTGHRGTGHMWVWGWRTAVLSLISAECLVLAAALLRPARNRAANAMLAALLVVVVGVIAPFTLGFAGAYDAWPWLSFCPFAITLAVGPLLYGYAHALATGRPPARWKRHLGPAAGQFAYLAVCFTLPSGLKLAWNAHVHERLIAPALQIGALLSVGGYAVAAARLLRRYRTQLTQWVSDPPRYAAGWLAGVLRATVLILAAWAAYRGWETVFGRLSYLDSFGLYVVLGAVALYLAVEGWRHADLAFPSLDAVTRVSPTLKVATSRDWRPIGEQWAAKVEAEALWRDPELNLARLAAHLGANTNHLSRALNEGLGLNFAAFVNGLRARAVAQALRSGWRGDLLTLALEEGFSSKASFNRAFSAEFGMSPSAYRREHGSEPKSSAAEPEVRRLAL